MTKNLLVAVSLSLSSLAFAGMPAPSSRGTAKVVETSPSESPTAASTAAPSSEAPTASAELKTAAPKKAARGRVSPTK